MNHLDSIIAVPRYFDIFCCQQHFAMNLRGSTTTKLWTADMWSGKALLSLPKPRRSAFFRCSVSASNFSVESFRLQTAGRTQKNLRKRHACHAKWSNWAMLDTWHFASYPYTWLAGEWWCKQALIYIKAADDSSLSSQFYLLAQVCTGETTSQQTSGAVCSCVWDKRWLANGFVCHLGSRQPPQLHQKPWWSQNSKTSS